MQYLFRWDEIPGEDTERFIGFLIEDFGADWTRNAKVDKSDDGSAIYIYSENHHLSMRVNSEKTRAILTIDFGKTYEFTARTENARLYIYKMQKDLDYLYSLRYYITAITGIFIISIIISFIVTLKYPEFSKSNLEAVEKFFEQLKSWIMTFNPPALRTIVLLLVIFLNNALKSLAAIVLGIGFGLFPLYLVVVNGETIAIVVDLVSREKGIIYVIAALLPHGIIEIPMVLLSASIGLRLGYMTYQSLKGKPTDIKKELKSDLRFYATRIAPLLFVAAMIETFLTPLIVSLVSGIP